MRNTSSEMDSMTKSKIVNRKINFGIDSQPLDASKVDVFWVHNPIDQVCKEEHASRGPHVNPGFLMNLISTHLRVFGISDKNLAEAL